MALYDSVVKKRPKQRIRPLWIVLLVICLLALLIMGLVISKPQRDHDRFIDCMGALSDSTSYTFRTKIPMLRATVDGQELRISEENGYALYKKLFNTSFLAFSSDIPEGACGWCMRTGRCWSCGPMPWGRARLGAREFSFAWSRRRGSSMPITATGIR